MRTTILAYVIVLAGLVMIATGAWDVYVLYSGEYSEQIYQVALSDYAPRD